MPNDSFAYLDIQMGNEGSVYQDHSNLAANQWRSYPNNFVYSGYWNGDYANSRGFQGHYWSRITNSSNQARKLMIEFDRLYQEYDFRQKGLSIRCMTQ